MLSHLDPHNCEAQSAKAFSLARHPRFLFSREHGSGHLRFDVTDVPPQPNSQPGDNHKQTPFTCPRKEGPISVAVPRAETKDKNAQERPPASRYGRLSDQVSEETVWVVVFHLLSKLSHLRYIPNVPPRRQTRVKLNRVFFPRRRSQVRSLDCGFASQWMGTARISLVRSCTSVIRRRGIWLP